MTFNFTGN
jgi:hypothetical protein